MRTHLKASRHDAAAAEILVLFYAYLFTDYLLIIFMRNYDRSLDKSMMLKDMYFHVYSVVNFEPSMSESCQLVYPLRFCCNQGETPILRQ